MWWSHWKYKGAKCRIEKIELRKASKTKIKNVKDIRRILYSQFLIIINKTIVLSCLFLCSTFFVSFFLSISVLFQFILLKKKETSSICWLYIYNRKKLFWTKRYDSVLILFCEREKRVEKLRNRVYYGILENQTFNLRLMITSFIWVRLRPYTMSYAKHLWSWMIALCPHTVVNDRIVTKYGIGMIVCGRPLFKLNSMLMTVH